jgi:hypothetical protein
VESLQRRIAPHLLRRVKEDVAKDIPPKEEVHLFNNFMPCVTASGDGVQALILPRHSHLLFLLGRFVCP